MDVDNPCELESVPVSIQIFTRGNRQVKSRVHLVSKDAASVWQAEPRQYIILSPFQREG